MGYDHFSYSVPPVVTPGFPSIIGLLPIEHLKPSFTCFFICVLNASIPGSGFAFHAMPSGKFINCHPTIFVVNDERKNVAHTTPRYNKHHIVFNRFLISGHYWTTKSSSSTMYFLGENCNHSVAKTHDDTKNFLRRQRSIKTREYSPSFQKGIVSSEIQSSAVMKQVRITDV